ncbi:vacuolar ATPase assembly integral membrane protein vma21 [Sporothrix epigloea]|uniref:Vacuolar ATPase assembly integral membrane protein vma21 n=1 Tax=Sporothrix epigloea TaxID=1892477 RepID=A0ABP0DG35_9PEZI
MAARRLAAGGKMGAETDGTVTPSPPANAQGRTAPAVPKSVIFKLLGFTFTMIVAPIGSYFATVDRLFSGNSTYAGALAAIIANVVLVAYVIVAFYEDQSDQLAEKDAKKNS